MQLNKAKFINVLKNIEYTYIDKKRSWDTIYNNKTTTFWNNLLWSAILEDSNLFGKSIDCYEFYNFCEYYCNYDEAKTIFDSINKKNKINSFQ